MRREEVAKAAARELSPAEYALIQDALFDEDEWMLESGESPDDTYRFLRLVLRFKEGDPE